MQNFRILKSYLVVILSSASICINAQTTTFNAPILYHSEYHQSVDDKLLNLDKAQISTGILYDRIYPVGQLPIFNQTQADTSNYLHFKQCISELYWSAYTRTGMPNDENIGGKITELKIANKVGIGTLLYKYNIIEPNALSNNLLSLDNNGLVYDVPNRPSSPYIEKTTFVASVLTDEITTGPTIFKYADALNLENTNYQVSSLFVNFDDGQGAQVLTPDAEITVNYSSRGQKVISILVLFSNNTFQNTYSKFNVIETTANNFIPCKIDSVLATIAFTSYEPSPNDVVKGKGEAGYYFANLNGTGRDCARTKVRKPIVILDGFDPNDARGISRLNEDQLKYLNTTNVKKNLLEDDLLAEDYDVVILNFPLYKVDRKYAYTRRGQAEYTDIFRDGGADYVERNGYVLVKLLQELNQQMLDEGSTEKITVIGPSMGGLISRFALKYMEQNNIIHNVKLWLSLDSPHHGANIAIGNQLLLEYFAKNLGIQGAKDAVQLQLDSPAARQMLLHHYRAVKFPVAGADPEVVAGCPGYRAPFYNALQSMGFPNNCIRKVSVFNGNDNGIVTFNACQRSVEIVAKALWYSNVAEAALFGTIGAFFNVAKVLTARTYSAPDYNNRCVVFEKEFLLGFKYSTAFVKGNGYSKSLDNLPGGYYDVNNEIKTFGETKKILYGIKVTNLHPEMTFIPSASALALNNPNVDWSGDFSNIDYKASTPFDSAFAPSNLNENHVFLTAKNVAFVKRQLGYLSTCTNCPSNIITAENVGQGVNQLVHANQTISSSNIIPEGSKINYKAGNSILFLPGFTAIGGSVITSDIEGCVQVPLFSINKKAP